jgi:adenosylcobinamide-phosphate synthase
MRLEYQLLIAVALDLLLGDPRWLPHPVRAIGTLAVAMEKIARRWFGSTRFAGAIAAVSVYLLAGITAWGAIVLACRVNPLAGDIVSIVILYTTIAARDLASHAVAIYLPLMQNDLPTARRRLGAIVGRDTERLDSPEIIRAAVESVAESTVDGVTAPLFFAFVAGPVGAMVYRAINTLDSMYGHQDERYGRFGWAAAKIDDLVNYLPARITAPLLCLAAWFLRLSPRRAWKILIRDGRKHSSPNSGLPEAAMAGALGVQLGGTNFYAGVRYEKPTIGDADSPLIPKHIRLSVGLMFLTTLLFIVIGAMVRWGTISFWNGWRYAA